MGIEYLLEHASRIMTVVTCATFSAILAWTYLLKRERDFAQAAAVPFDDDDDAEAGHV